MRKKPGIVGFGSVFEASLGTGGTRLISDWLIIQVKTLPGQSFLDRMIAMVEGAKRQKTPNQIALAILLAALTLIFLLVVAPLLPYSIYSVTASGQGQPISLTVLVALFVCLAPTTIGALLSAIGIAGMNRLSQANVIARSGRAVETQRLWSARYGREVSMDEAIEILSNVKRFAEMLLERSEA